MRSGLTDETELARTTGQPTGDEFPQFSVGPGKGAGVGHGDTPILVFGKPISSLSAEIPKRLFVPFFFFFPYSDANILNLYTKGVKVGRSRGRKKRVG